MTVSNIIFFLVALSVIIGIFLMADQKVKKRNKEEYERTGIMPEYDNTDATLYVLKRSEEIHSSTYRLRYILSGVMSIVGGIAVIHFWVKWDLQLQGTAILIIGGVFGLPSVTMILVGIVRIIKGIKMK